MYLLHVPPQSFTRSKSLLLQVDLIPQVQLEIWSLP